nr:hypothetical protein [Natrinema longum]
MDRRTVLSGVAGLSGVAVAGCSAFERETDGQTTQVDEDRARALATRFAPSFYFDTHEPWFPTDPRPYSSERDGETVVTGFDAFDGYHERYSDSEPPNPTVFYHAVEYEDSPLAVVQFWCYSAFDQFTTNFHWHDWEVLHVFVDTETEEPQLYVASSHSRTVPNNEFLDPEPDMTPRILSELGSHSSALSVNDVADRFQRVAVEDLLADITNTALEGIEDLADIPLAYGLPRDEGSTLPYLVPEYEGQPIYDHEKLPSVTRESLITDELTVRSFDALTSPPTDLPARETGLVFQHRDRPGEADIEYELVPSTDLEHITAFTGPQLSFEFSVPDQVEDALAGHLTTTGTPWSQPRYENPAADISVPTHRTALADRYDAIGEAAPINTVVSRVTETITAEDAPVDEGLTTTDTSLEAVALLESDPEAVPTFGGVAVAQGVPAGDHRLTVNSAGRAPHSERVSVSADGDGTTTVAGVDGEIPLVARDRATKLEVGDETVATDLAAVAVEDDFAGRLYESSVDGSDAVYVHDGGAYTTEVRDGDDAVGAYRVNPEPGAKAAVRIERPETGKASLAEFVVDVAEETRVEIASLDDEAGDTDATDDDRAEWSDDDDTADDATDESRGSSTAVTGLERALAAVVDAARRAAERARDGDRGNADRQLETVLERLERVSERLAEARDEVPESLSNASEKRLEQATRRSEQARNAEKLSHTP